MTNRIELKSTGHIQIRKVIDGQYWRGTISPDGELKDLPKDCTVILHDNKIIENCADTESLINDWRKLPEIKQAIEDYKNREDDI